MTITIGVDIGGSSTNAVAIDQAGQVVGRTRNVARIEGGKQAAAAAVAAIAALEIDGYSAVGIGIPGLVDGVTGEVAMAVNLGIGTTPYPIASEVEAVLGVPVTIENDVRAAAFGAYESLRTSGTDPHSLALVSIGTGICAGVVLEGELLRGAHGMAGEIGHVVVDESGPLCRCGQRGCLEAVAAGPAIARAWPKGTEGSAATALFAAAAAGDAAAAKVAGRIAGYLTTSLTWLAAAYDTERIVIGGGVSDAGDSFLIALRERIGHQAAASELAARRLRPEQVTLASIDDPPGPRGAAVLAAQRLASQHLSRDGVLSQSLLTTRVSPARTKATNAK
jgi:predicted NBD/HSP70 family sugar kinase